MDAFNFMYERKEETILYASFPQMSDLCCVICETDFIEVHDSSAKSNFHWQTMKCRLLIHLISDVIASPVLGTERFIFVIAHKIFFETGRLETILRNFKLVYQGLRSVTTELYKACLIYTIQSKIAPLWNKVGDYFIQGKEFYNFIEGARAIKLDILIEENNMCLRLHAEKVKIPYIKLEDYLSSSIISQFLADPKGYINLSHYNLPFAYVLPSTKKGKLLSVSKELPEKCVFKDYDELRRHCKNMYGYSLPKNKDGILYYEIKFLIPKSKIFTYPNTCIASAPLEIIPSRDKEPSITCFLSDILAKLPAVCGKQLQISKHTPFTTKYLSTNLSSNISSKDKGLSTHLKQTSDTTPQLVFSDTYVDGLIKDTNTSLKKQLAKIHQIHYVPFRENIKTNSSNKNIKENQNEIQCLNTIQSSSTQNMNTIPIKNNLPKGSNNNFTVSKEETISRYFKIQKTRSYVNTGEPIQEEKQKRLTLREKLLRAKSSENSNTFLSETDQNVTVEAMAKRNQLEQMKNSDLSDWLRRHSIPHNSHGKKDGLINKVLSHMRNTQISQFRM